jgi:hypothetical protein
MPISRGAGWSWGPRSRDRAFVIGVGRGGYVGDEGWGTGRRATSEQVDAVNGKHETDVSTVNGSRAGRPTVHDESPVTDSRQDYEMEPQRGYVGNGNQSSYAIQQ